MKHYFKIFTTVIACLCNTLLVLAQHNNPRPNVLLPNEFSVNSYTGNLYHSRTDMRIPSQGLDIELTYAYNATRLTINKGVGRGWSFMYGAAYRSESNGIWIERGDGRKDFYRINNGAFIAPPGVFDTLIQTQPGRLMLQAKNGLKHFFDNAQHKRLTKIEDRYGNNLILSYTDSLLAGLTDGLGHQLAFTWTNGLIREIVDQSCPPFRTYKYNYDASGNLTKVVNPLLDSISYRYDNTGKMVGYTDENGYSMAILYNPSGAVNKVVSCVTSHTFSYASAQHRTFVAENVNGQKQVTTYQFDTLGRLLNKKGNCCGFNLTYRYDEDNNIAESRDGNNNATRYQYDANGNVVKITDAAGKVITYTYEPAFNLQTSIKDRNSHTTSHQYDAQGNLVQVNKPLGIVEKATFDAKGNRLNFIDGNNHTTSYQYSPSAYLLKKTDAENGVMQYTYDCRGNRLTETDARGFTTTYEYDLLNRLTRKTDPLGQLMQYRYDKVGNLIESTDALGRITQFAYDGLNRNILVTSPLGIVNSTEYDEQGNIIKLVDGRGNATIYTYNYRRQVLSETDALGHSRTFEYDDAGNLTAIKDKRGNVTRRQYNNLNRLTKETDPQGATTTYTYDAEGNQTLMVDANGNLTAHAYDALNRLVKVTDALNKSALFTYDAANNRLTEQDRNGNITSYEYDKLNRNVKKTDALAGVENHGYDASGNRTQMINTLGHVVTMRYDPLDRLVSQKDAVGDSVVYQYDVVGNITGMTMANGHTFTYQYDADDRMVKERDAVDTIATYIYDNNDNVITEKDASGHITHFIYDKENKLLKINFANNTSQQFFYDANGNKVKEVNQKGYVTQFENDAVNRVVKIVDAEGSASGFAYNFTGQLVNITDAKGNITSYNYDALNRLTRQVYPDGTNRRFSYDANGQVLSKTLANGNVIGYQYDKLNRLVARNYPGNRKDSLTYDAAGRLIRAVNENAVVQFVYDNKNRLLSENLNGRITQYEHNTAARTRRVTYPAGMQLLMQQDGRGRITEIKEGGTALANFQYDGQNRIINKQYRNNTAAQYSYDNMGNLTAIQSTPATIMRINYAYDSADNRVLAEKTHRANFSESYQYDSVFRLKRQAIGQYNAGVVNPTKSLTYAYDGLGNRVAATENTDNRTYTANNLNQYATVVTNGSSALQQYDNRGNLLGNGINTFAYDDENRVTSIQNATGTVTYKYDALGRRIARVKNGIETTYAYSEDNIIEDLTAGATKSYIYAGETDHIVFSKTATAGYFYHTDDLNSVQTITDAAGNIAEYYSYDAFGVPNMYGPANLPLAASAIGNDILYTARQYEPEYRVYHYRNREMDPVTGRFVQRDPLEYLDGLNAYAYVNNNVINRVDPDGLVDWWGAAGATFGIIVNGIGAAGSAVFAVASSPSVVGTGVGVAGVGYFSYNVGANINNLIDAFNERPPTSTGAFLGDMANLIDPCNEWLRRIAQGSDFVLGFLGPAGFLKLGKLLKAKFTVDPNKFNYFFGRVVSGNPHNVARSAQNLKDLTTLGIKTEGQLMKVFKDAFKNGTTVSTKTNQYGTTVTKSINIGEKGSVNVSYFYKGGDMTATPSITTIIPKIFK